MATTIEINGQELTRNEIQALIKKARRNTFGNVSEFLVKGLIAKGLVDARTRRLTDEGIAAVETNNRFA